MYWARDNTSRKDIFIIPPHLSGFRIESERTVYVAWQDGTFGNLKPGFALEWTERLANVGGGVEMRYGLTEEDFKAVARRLRSAEREVYLIAPRQRGRASFPLVYANEEFIVYRIPSWG